MPCSQMVRQDIKQFPANSHLYWGENERKAKETDWQLKGSSEYELLAYGKKLKEAVR